MSFRRYEIVLPSLFNDGTPVPPEAHLATWRELLERFGGATLEPQILRGGWIHQGQRYEEPNLRLFADVEDTPENVAFFKEFKETLKRRFQQIDIWIISYEIQIT
jgi:hypothetical protein